MGGASGPWNAPCDPTTNALLALCPHAITKNPLFTRMPDLKTFNTKLVLTTSNVNRKFPPLHCEVNRHFQQNAILHRFLNLLLLV